MTRNPQTDRNWRRFARISMREYCRIIFAPFKLECNAARQVWRTFRRTYVSAPPPVKLFCCCAILFNSACSINEVGFVEVGRAQDKNTRVQALNANGIHLNTSKAHAGLYLGVATFVSAQAVACGMSYDRLSYVRLAGIHLGLSRSEFGITLGFRETLLTHPGAPNNGSSFRFDPERPLVTRITLFEPPNCNSTREAHDVSF